MEHVFLNDRPKVGGKWKIEINDCPCCGGSKITASACETQGNRAYSYIMCDTCGKQLAKYCNLNNVAEALDDIAADWNKLGSGKPFPPIEEQVLRNWDAPLLRMRCPKCNRILESEVQTCEQCGQELDWKTKTATKVIGGRKGR